VLDFTRLAVAYENENHGCCSGHGGRGCHQNPPPPQKKTKSFSKKTKHFPKIFFSKKAKKIHFFLKTKKLKQD
jgi:hypothetical protein